MAVVGFAMENINMARLFRPVVELLAGQGDRCLALCSRASADAASARDECERLGFDVFDLPPTPSLDVRLPRLPLAVRATRRRLADVAQGAGLDCLVAGNDQALLSGQLVESARRHAVPSVLVQDGLRVRWRDGGGGVALRGRLHLFLRRKIMDWGSEVPVYGGRGLTAIAAAGEVLREDLEKSGVTRPRIVLTGNPNYDYLQGVMHGAPVPVPRDDSFARILFVQQDLESVHPLRLAEYHRSIIRAICVGCVRNLVFKLHPRSIFSPEEIRVLVPNVGEFLDVPEKTTPIGNLLEDAHLLVTTYSTVAIEAIYRGIPVLFADWLRTPAYLVDGEEGREAGWVPELTDLPPTVSQALRDAAFRDRLWIRQRQLAEQHMMPPDGKAAERIAVLIRQVVRPSGGR